MERDIGFFDLDDSAALRAGVWPAVAVVSCALDDAKHAGWMSLDPTADDLRDERRPGASPRDTFRARRALTRGLVARRLGVEARDVVVAYDGDGAPRIVAPRGAGYISVAGRGSLAAVALSDGPVGVDIETIGAPQEPAWDVLHARERTHLRFLERDLWHRAFLETWVAKEAGLKALGLGLNRDPASVFVDRQGESRFTLSDDRGTWGAGRLVIRDDAIIAAAWLV